MKTLAMLFKKSFLIALVAALALSTLPLTSAYASGLGDPTDPPSDTTQLPAERLERVWTRLRWTYERQGHRLERADVLVERLQTRIDRLEESGKDVAALQAALDAFADTLREAHPIYESAKGIINAHRGFDADGKVTDQEQAVGTVKELGGKLKEIHEIVDGPGKALREAIKAFRDAHRPADVTGTQS